MVLSRYLSEQKLPARMLRLRNGNTADNCASTSSEDEASSDSGEDCIVDGAFQRTAGGLGTSPYVMGDLRILNLGKFLRSVKLLLPHDLWYFKCVFPF